MTRAPSIHHTLRSALEVLVCAVALGGPARAAEPGKSSNAVAAQAQPAASSPTPETVPAAALAAPAASAAAPKADAGTPAPALQVPCKPECEPEPPRESPLDPNTYPKAGGFHVFDAHYLLFGFNWQAPCGATTFELEASTVPVIWAQLWWLDVYASAGFQHYRRGKGGCTIDVREDPDKTSAARYRPFRAAGGIGAGWRFLGLDAGVVYNDALWQPKGVRLRGGISLANELFSGGSVTFSRQCCTKGQDAEPCECPRTPVGVALFLFYAYEYYWGNTGHPVYRARRPDATDGMIGLSFKVGFGL